MGPRTAAALSLFVSGATGVGCFIVLVRHLEAALGRPGAGIGVLLGTTALAVAATCLATAGSSRVQARPWARLGELDIVVGVLLWAAVPGMRVGFDAFAASGRSGAVLAGAALLWLPFAVATGLRWSLLAGAPRRTGRVEADVAAIPVILLALGAALGCCIWALWTLPGFDLVGSLAAAGSVQIATGLLIRARTQGLSPKDDSAPGPGSATEIDSLVGWPAIAACFASAGFVGVGAALVLRLPVGIVSGATLPGAATAAALGFLGIALGGGLAATAMASRRQPVRSFAWLQLALGAGLAGVVALLPDLSFFHLRLAGAEVGVAGVLRAALVFVPIALLPGVLLGAALAMALRLVVFGPHTTGPKTRSGRTPGTGWLVALAAGAGGASLGGALVAYALAARLGLDVTLFAVVLCSSGAGAVLLVTTGADAEPARRGSGASFASALAVLLLVSFGYGGISIAPTLAGAGLDDSELLAHRAARASGAAAQLLVIARPDGLVSIEETTAGRTLRTDGLAAAETRLAPPYLPAPDFWLGVAPYLLSERPERALLLDLSGGSSSVALLGTALPSIQVVDPRADLPEAVRLLHQGRSNPLDNPRLSFLQMAPRLALAPRPDAGVDILASHPKHVFRVEDASRLTGSFFDLARDRLREGGVFASTLPLARMDPEAALSAIAQFEASLPGAVLLDVSQAADRSALLLLGSTAPLAIDPAELRRRMAEPALARSLARYAVETPEDLLARIEGLAADFAARAPHPALPQLRMELSAALAPRDATLAFALLAGDAPEEGALLPELVGEPDWRALALSIARRGQGAKLHRLLADPRTQLSALDRGLAQSLVALGDPAAEAAALARLERLATEYPEDVSALRVAAMHLATRRGRFDQAAALFGEAFERSGAGRDAYDAARAWDRIDPTRALEWVRRIPAAERADFPRIALYEAKAALATRRDGDADEILRLLVALTEYRRSSEGRRLFGVAAVLSDLAEAAGRPRLSAIHAEADRSERSRRLEVLLARARADLADADFDTAAQRLAAAGQVAPGSAALIEMEVRLAAARGDPEGAARSLDVLRIHAASPEQAIERENALRRDLGLPLLPLFAVDEILAAGS